MPLLTVEQLQEIRQIIEDHHDAFVVNTIGADAVPQDVLARLRERGLVNVKVESIKDAYIYGQLLAMMESDRIASMSYEEFKAHLKRNPVPLSEAEVHAVQMAQQVAGASCKGLGNVVNRRAGGILIEGDAALRARTEGIIRDATALNIARRETVSRLKSDLGWATRDWNRDWTRIAVTEKQNAMQHGVADYYRDEYGPSVLVAKRAMPSACKHCDRLHNGPDNQPRIFRLSDLEENGTNIGRKANDWLPVVGTVHPHCHPGGSPVETAGGEISIEEVRPGDLVSTHRNRWRRVSHVWESSYCSIMVEVELTDGRRVRATLGHPLLTTRGWVPAERLNVRDKLVELPASPALPAFDDLDSSQQPPMLRENRSFASVLFGFSRRGVPVTAVHFNGELYVRESQVDVDRVDSVVRGGVESSHLQPPMDLAFVGRGEFTDAGLSFGDQFFSRCPTPTAGSIRFLGEPPLLEIGEFGHAKSVGFSLAAGVASSLQNPGDNCASRYPQGMGYLFYRHQLVEVQIEDGGGVEFNPAVPVPFGSGHDSVSPVGIASVKMAWFEGNVYNLTVDEDRSYLVNGVVSHNCQCQMIRVPEGWGFDKDGDLVPDGELGVHYDGPEDVLRSMRLEDELQKAFKLQGHVNFKGLPIAIENKAGSVRTWEDGQGVEGKTEMLVGYGYIKRTNGTDEDEIDVFVGPDPKSEMVYVIEQQLPKEGRYDEQKCMVGFPNQLMAEAVYQAHFDRPDYQLYTTAMPLDQFKRWIQETQQAKGEMMKASESKYRLVIPLSKARVATIVGAATSQAGNQSPSQYGTTPNYIMQGVPDRPVPESLKDVGYRPDSRELSEHFYQDFEAENPLKRDREVYEFPESERIVRPLVVPDEMAEAQEDAREGADKRMRYLLNERIINKPRPKNTAEVPHQGLQKSGKDRAPTLNKEGQFTVIAIGPRGGKIIGYQGGKPIYLHKLSPRQKAKLTQEAKKQGGKPEPQAEKKKPKREPVPKKEAKPTEESVGQGDEKETPPKGPPEAYEPDPTPPPGEVAAAARVGVPAKDVPPPPKIPRLPNLNPEERAAESKFADAFEADPDGMADAFYEKSAGENFVFETDGAKELMPEWADKENRGKLNTALHQTANAIAKKAFLKRLDEIADMPEEKRKILVTSGGVAGGKGTALKAQPDLAASVSATWDAAGEQNATENEWLMEECEKRGIKPVFLFVNAKPEITWNGAIARAKGIGRMVDARVFSDSYAHGAKNFKAFYDKLKDTGKADFVFAQAGLFGPPKVPAEIIDDFPEESLNLDAEELYKKSLAVIEKQKADLPPFIVEAATAGMRIWKPKEAKA